MNEPEDRPPGMIGARTAAILYLVLAAIAVAVLRGKPLFVGLIIIAGLAAKSFLHHWKQKHETED